MHVIARIARSSSHTSDSVNVTYCGSAEKRLFSFLCYTATSIQKLSYQQALPTYRARGILSSLDSLQCDTVVIRKSTFSLLASFLMFPPQFKCLGGGWACKRFLRLCIQESQL